ncbi:hypothetical protein B0J12DRAFT_661371, partial [Macrophomina phaseolina]
MPSIPAWYTRTCSRHHPRTAAFCSLFAADLVFHFQVHLTATIFFFSLDNHVIERVRADSFSILPRRVLTHFAGSFFFFFFFGHALETSMPRRLSAPAGMPAAGGTAMDFRRRSQGPGFGGSM